MVPVFLCLSSFCPDFRQTELKSDTSYEVSNILRELGQYSVR